MDEEIEPKKREYLAMRKLYLVGGTPVDQLEGIILQAIKKVKKKTGKQLTYTIEAGRATTGRHNQLRGADIVVMLNTDTYKSNQDLVPIDAVGFIVSDPMNLNCIVGRCVERFDFAPTENGLKYTFTKPDPADAATKLAKALMDKTVHGKVTIDSLRYVPTVINSTGEDVTTFVHTLIALSYSIRDEVTRQRFRMAFIHWIPTSNTIEHLKAQLMEIGGWKRSERLDAFCVTLEENKLLRDALKRIYNGVHAEKGSVGGRAMPDVGKLAEHAKVSVFDLRYITGLMRKNPLTNSQVAALHVHLQRVAKRYEDTMLEAETETTEGRDMEALIERELEKLDAVEDDEGEE